MNIHVLIILLHCFTLCIAKKWLIKADRIEVYDPPENSPITVENIKLYFSAAHGSYGDVDVQLSRDIDNTKIWFSLKVIRCANKETLDTCEFFANLKPSNVCFFLKSKGMGWDNIVYHFSPPLICPFSKGNYTGRNIFFDPNFFNLFPIHDHYWKVTGAAYEDKELLLTGIFECQFIAVYN